MSGEYTAQTVRNGKPTGEIIARGTQDEVAPYWKAGEVAICWNADHKPLRRWSQAGTASARKKRLMNRLRKKHPLFAAQLYKAEIAARPDYYAATDKAEDTQQ